MVLDVAVAVAVVGVVVATLVAVDALVVALVVAEVVDRGPAVAVEDTLIALVLGVAVVGLVLVETAADNHIKTMTEDLVSP